MDGLSFPRYSTAPFPSYRFIPGKSPHPTAHPDGHSYRPAGTPEPHVDLPRPEDWAASDTYLLATDLYNHGYWWEAHETWEALWQVSDKGGVQGRFLQGLIQLAACHLKWHMGHLDGVARLRESSLKYLRAAQSDGSAGEYMGLEVTNLCTAVEIYYADQRQRYPIGGQHDPAAYPYLRLNPGCLA